MPDCDGVIDQLEIEVQAIRLAHPATATIAQRPHGSVVEARGGKVLPIRSQSCARRSWGRGLEVAEMSKDDAMQRSSSWSVQHGS
jgi:hypothetical protein